MILPILRFGALPRLVVPPVSESDFQHLPFQKEVDDLLDTLKATHRALALAAPQVGMHRRFFIMRESSCVFRVVVNPEIEVAASSRLISQEEGCVSFPDEVLFVPRHRKIKVTWQDRRGNRMASYFSGLEARIFQHETDHLNGITFEDRVIEAENAAEKARLERRQQERQRLEKGAPSSPAVTELIDADVNFDSYTGWSTVSGSAGWAITGGQLINILGNVGHPGASLVTNLDRNATYRLTVDVESVAPLDSGDPPLFTIGGWINFLLENSGQITHDFVPNDSAPAAPWESINSVGFVWNDGDLIQINSVSLIRLP